MKVQTIEMCHRYGIAVFSGALTPTEVITAWEAGSDAVKVFPCSAVGGASYLKALRAPMPQLQLIPTGGVSLSTAESFLKAGAFALGVGGDLVNSDAATEAEFNAMTENAKNYLPSFRGTGRHLALDWRLIGARLALDWRSIAFVRIRRFLGVDS